MSAQAPLSAIDSLYFTSVEEFYKRAEKLKGKIWEGMKINPVCLFRSNGPAFLFNHPNPPDNFRKLSDKLYVGKQSDLRLYGATQTEINGTLTAVNDYGNAYYSCIEEAYAELFHELHHVYQRTHIQQIGFDNPADLMTYPEEIENDAIKLYEQKLLYQMCFEQDNDRFQRLLNQFYSCRLERKKIIGNYIQYEKSVESMEGPAFFCEYMFYNQYKNINDAIRNNYNQKHFWSILTTLYFGRNSLRKRHLAAGLAMCYILNREVEDWQSDYYSQSNSLYDFFISKLNPQAEELKIDSSYFQQSKFFTNQEILQHRVSFNKFNAQEGFKITLKFSEFPQFKGFDPMHAETINDSTILHKTMLNLSGCEQNNLFITNSQAITTIDNEIWNVKKVILYAPMESINLQDHQISVVTAGKKIKWLGQLKLKTEKELIFKCK